MVLFIAGSLSAGDIEERNYSSAKIFYEVGESDICRAGRRWVDVIGGPVSKFADNPGSIHLMEITASDTLCAIMDYTGGYAVYADTAAYLLAQVGSEEGGDSIYAAVPQYGVKKFGADHFFTSPLYFGAQVLHLSDSTFIFVGLHTKTDSLSVDWQCAGSGSVGFYKEVEGDEWIAVTSCGTSSVEFNAGSSTAGNTLEFYAYNHTVSFYLNGDYVCTMSNTDKMPGYTESSEDVYPTIYLRNEETDKHTLMVMERFRVYQVWDY